MIWERRTGNSFGSPDPFIVGLLQNITYVCRHCRKRWATFVLYAGPCDRDDEASVQLIGRIPKPLPFIHDELEEALAPRSVDLYLYSNALSDRADGRGIGAMTYMRRVVENEMNALIDLMITNLSGSSEQEKLDALAAAQRLRGENSFREKARVADTLLPESFFPGSQNPFLKLHDLCSDG
ncbi:MAG: hypothetical protein ACREMY_30120, partial [bacterium]